MIDALISGKVYGQPKEGMGKNGSPFVTAKVRATGGDAESLLISVIAFSESARNAILILGDGEAISLAGSLTLRVWKDKEGTARPGADLVAHTVLTAYHVTRKRKAITDTSEPTITARGT